MKARIVVKHTKDKTKLYSPEVFTGGEWICCLRGTGVYVGNPLYTKDLKEAEKSLDYYFYEPPADEIIEYTPQP